jgi:hypothetical protein
VEFLSYTEGTPQTCRTAAGGSYTGYRIGIAADGAWIFFVAGD